MSSPSSAVLASSPSSSSSPPRRALLALAAVYLVWGSTYLGVLIGLEGFPPMLLSGIRFLVAGGALFAVLAARGAPLPDARQWRGAIPVGLLLFTVGNGCVCVAEVHIGSGVAAVVVATMPLWMAVFAAISGERPGGREWLGIGIGFAAVLVLSVGSDLRADAWATIVLLGAPVGWALGSIIARRQPAGRGGLIAVAAAQMLAGGAGAALLGLASGERIAELPPARPLVAMIYLVLVGSFVGFIAYSWLLRHTRPAVATSYAFVNPVIAVALGALLAAEPLTWQTLLATPMVAAAVALVVTARAA
jgi:drug/metabolite transporter (DMT)-like permease